MSDPKFYCRAEDLAIGYGKTPLMEHIGLGVEKGSILTLIGPNGAGKSTLLKTLAAQLAPPGGRCPADGKNLCGLLRPGARPQMALMVPHTRRTELTTCFEMASAGRYPYTGRLGVLSAEDKRQVHAALALVGAEALAGRDFNRISDGQRQRVLLARAICQQPELILLDEPTSFLDIKGKAELLAILKSLARDKKMAVILSLHELELAQKVSDKVVCVSAAGVSDVMTPEEAFARENICKIYALTDEQYAFLYGEEKRRRSARSLSTTSAAARSSCAAAIPPAPARRWARRARHGCCSPAAPPRRWPSAPRRASWWRWSPSSAACRARGPSAPSGRTAATMWT